MKPIYAFIVLAGMAAQASSQTLYTVPANSKGNSVSLTIANQSPTIDAFNVQVRLLGKPSVLMFGSMSNAIKLLPAGKESEVSFMFDVDREARIDKRDTLQFLITDKTGSAWTKSIIVSYGGPQEFRLEQNFPNPFNPSTTIYYQLPVNSRVTLKVYDILGREVRTLLEEEQAGGFRNVRFDGLNLATGAYICRLRAEPTNGSKPFVSVLKMLLVR